jgi:hypothetical protein
MMLPQPSPTAPQLAPSCVHVLGVQGGAPHWLATPPDPQLCGTAQEPHCKTLPQPSPIAPQVAPACAQVRGVQLAMPQTFPLPPPPHA